MGLRSALLGFGLTREPADTDSVVFRVDPSTGPSSLVPYALVSVATLILAALATTVAAAIAPGGHDAQTLFVGVAYFGTYGTLFVAKFVVYQRFIFGDDASGRRSQ